MPKPKLGVNKLPNGTLLKGAEAIIEIETRADFLSGTTTYEVRTQGSDTFVPWDDVLRFRQARG